MSISLAIIILAALLANAVFRKLRMPGLLGLLLVGVCLGPYVLNLIRPDLLTVSADLRQIALIVILLRAGFEMSRRTIAQVGRTALVIAVNYIPHKDASQ